MSPSRSNKLRTIRATPASCGVRVNEISTLPARPRAAPYHARILRHLWLDLLPPRQQSQLHAHRLLRDKVHHPTTRTTPASISIRIAEISTSPPDHTRPIPHHNMVDLDSNGRFIAASFDLDILHLMTAEQLNHMSFVGFPQRYGHGALNKLILFNPRHGKLDPPASQLLSGKVIREWRNRSQSDQKYLLQKTEDGPPPATIAVSCC